MNASVTIAAFSALLAAIVVYMLFAAKSAQRFSPSISGDSLALKLVSALGDDILGALPASADRYMGGEASPRVESLLVRSGNPWGLTAKEFTVLRWVSGFLGFFAGWGVWLLVATSGIPWFIVVPAVSLFCYMIPKVKYEEQAKLRDMAFRRQLPEALDLVTISLSGGTTFARAVRDVIPTMQDGILKAEFRNMVRIMDTGGTLKEALDEFASRAPNDGVLTFIRSVQSASEVNAPMNEILESRAKASREEFFAYIHEKTAQLESKIWMILAPTLLPAVIIVGIAPAATSLASMLGS